MLKIKDSHMKNFYFLTLLFPASTSLPSNLPLLPVALFSSPAKLQEVKLPLPLISAHSEPRFFTWGWAEVSVTQLQLLYLSASWTSLWYRLPLSSLSVCRLWFPGHSSLCPPLILASSFPLMNPFLPPVPWVISSSISWLGINVSFHPRPSLLRFKWLLDIFPKILAIQAESWIYLEVILTNVTFSFIFFPPVFPASSPSSVFWIEFFLN